MSVSKGLPVWVAPSARLAEDVELAPFVYIGEDVAVGAKTALAPFVTIIGPAVIGCRCRIGPGTVIGCEGFGYEPSGSGFRHLEHAGRVVIEDDVEIGANCTIARARTGRETRIGRGTKIDCQVHIGHNVQIGQDCIIVAQTGIAGSAVIGDRVMLGGQAGVKDHVEIGNDSILYAKSALFRSIPPGSRYSGIPARPHHEVLRLWARLWRIIR
ncbi:MAG: UDP-3-O-(3-hydroxymyristoyl)glucosamine N-acyltransferase [candidate division WOR-3 bacterium]